MYNIQEIVDKIATHLVKDNGTTLLDSIDSGPMPPGHLDRITFKYVIQGLDTLYLKYFVLKP